ncbi:MAG: LexA family protein [Rhodothermales bacterium]
MQPSLTQRQNDALNYIRTYMHTFRKPPTLKEIGDALGIRSTNGTFKLLQTLEQKGYIERERHAARGIRLLNVDADQDPFAPDDGPGRLIVVSRTASDQPELLRDNPSAIFSVDPFFLRNARDPKSCILGRAGDDGMNGDGIRKGDLLIIEQLSLREVRNGTIAAALVRETLLIRRYDLTNGRIHLRPANRHYTEETFSPSDPGCYIIGCVIGLMRRF